MNVLHVAALRCASFQDQASIMSWQHLCGVCADIQLFCPRSEALHLFRAKESAYGTGFVASTQALLFVHQSLFCWQDASNRTVQPQSMVVGELQS